MNGRRYWCEKRDEPMESFVFTVYHGSYLTLFSFSPTLLASYLETSLVSRSDTAVTRDGRPLVLCLVVKQAKKKDNWRRLDHLHADDRTQVSPSTAAVRPSRASRAANRTTFTDLKEVPTASRMERTRRRRDPSKYYRWKPLTPWLQQPSRFERLLSHLCCYSLRPKNN